MEIPRLILLKIIFISLIICVSARSFKKSHHHHHKKDPLSVIPLPDPKTSSDLDNNDLVPVKPLKVKEFKLHAKKRTHHVAESKSELKSEPQKNLKGNEVFSYQGHKTSKVKRDAHTKSWTNYGMNPPPYLVFNRKIGAYYPYYKFPKDNSVRRDYMTRRYFDKMQRQNQLQDLQGV